MILVENIIQEIANIMQKDKTEIESMIERPENINNGDYCLPCFKFSKELKKSPQEIAQNIKEQLKLDEIEKIEVVSGYLNIFVNKNMYIQNIFEEMREKKEEYGSTGRGKNKKTLIEHTSINPNASPHIGRARNALIGDCIVNVLKFNNYVQKLSIEHLKHHHLLQAY